MGVRKKDRRKDEAHPFSVPENLKKEEEMDRLGKVRQSAELPY